MYKFAPSTQDVTVYFRLRDSTTGLAKNGLTAGSAGVVASYARKGGSATSIGLSALASPTAPHSDGGFIEVNSATAKGLYRLDLPDAALVSGVPFTVVNLAFTGVIEEAVLVRLETPTQTAGAGSIAFTVTINNVNNGLPIAGAAVWVTTDLEGTNVVAGTLTTNAFGKVTPLLDPGVYYVWVAAEDFSGTNPTLITVS